MNIFNENISLEVLKLAIEQSYNSVVITTSNLDFPEFVYVNGAFTKMSGYTMDDLKHKTPKILQGEKTNRELIKILKEKLSKGEFFQGSTVNYRKDGSEYYVEWNISPIKDSNSNIIYYISMQRDITKEIILEKKREEILINQSKLATLGEMMETITHQWKQPLTAINLSIDNLLFFDDDNKIDSEIKDTLEIIKLQSNFMNQTMNDFKRFLKSSNQKTDFNLKDEIDFVCKILNIQILKNSIDLTIDVDERLSINGYDNEFKQVLLNIINNSIDAYESQKIKNGSIKIYAKNEDSIKLYIEDSAGGVKDELLDKIFLSKFSTKGDKGTGIGLYISKVIIEKMGGKIGAKNTKNGVVFTLELLGEEVK